MPPPVPDQIEKEIRRITDFIIESHERIKSGAMVDITCLEADMEALSRQILAAPRDIITKNQKFMDILRLELDSLFRTLEDIYHNSDKVH